MDKKGEPTYIRLSKSNQLRIHLLSAQFGDIHESEIIDWLVGLGLDLYEFQIKHFATFPVGLNFRARQEESKDDSR